MAEALVLNNGLQAPTTTEWEPVFSGSGSSGSITYRPTTQYMFLHLKVTLSGTWKFSNSSHTPWPGFRWGSVTFANPHFKSGQAYTGTYTIYNGILMLVSSYKEASYDIANSSFTPSFCTAAGSLNNAFTGGAFSYAITQDNLVCNTAGKINVTIYGIKSPIS